MAASTSDIYLEHTEFPQELRRANRMKYYHDFDITNKHEKKEQAFLQLKKLKEHICSHMNKAAHKGVSKNSQAKYTMSDIYQSALLNQMPLYPEPTSNTYIMAGLFLLITNIIICSLY